MALTIPRHDWAHLRSDSRTSFISESLSGSHAARQSSQASAQAAQIWTRRWLPLATSLAVVPRTSAQSMHRCTAWSYSTFPDRRAWRRQKRKGDALRKSFMVNNLRRYFHQKPLLLPGSKRETGDGLGSGAGRSKSLPAMLVEVHWQ